MSYGNAARRVGWSTVAIGIYAVLLVPILVIILTSFTTQPFPTIPKEGVTLRWYAEVLSSGTILSALATSFFVAAVSSVLATVVGTVAAFGFVRSQFRFKETVATLMLLPLMISPVITGLALVQYFNQVGLNGSYVPLFLGHTVLTLPYVFLIVRAELADFDRTLEQASRVLGAGSLESVANVTLPTIAPAMVSSGLIAFVVSFGEFTATQFLVSPGTTTIPVIIYTQLRSGLSPSISALSAILVGIMFAAAIVSAVVTRGN